MNQTDTPVGFKNKTTAIARVDIELPKGDDVHYIRAIAIGHDNKIVDIAEAPLINDIAAYMGKEFGISKAYLFERHEFRLAYNQRFIAAEQFNDEESKKAGLLSQFEANGVTYSLIAHAAYRIARPMTPSEDAAGYFELLLQRSNEEDPDKAFISSDAYATVQQATFEARNHIERDLFAAFM